MKNQQGNIVSNLENHLKKLKSFLEKYNTKLTIQDYEKDCEEEKNSLVSAVELPRRLNIINSSQYSRFQNKEIETRIAESREEKNLEVYLLINCREELVASKIAKIYIGRLASFEEELIDATITHLLWLGLSVKENNLFFPKNLYPYINESHYDIELLKSKIGPFLFNYNPPYFHIFSPKDIKQVFENFKFSDNC
ncbi:MAG: hypothetical protein QXG86_00060 [Candidatus Woesearchaeota archaeon]